MGVGAGGVVSVSLKDNSTTAGVWSVHGSNTEPGLVTIDATLSSTYYGGSGGDGAAGISLALNANQSLHFAQNSGRASIYAYIVDNIGKQVTTPVLVASVGLRVGAAFSISASSAIVFYTDNAGSTIAVVLSISGTTITVGSPASIAGSSTGIYWQEDGYTGPRIAQLSPTLYLVSGTYGGSTAANTVAAFSVSGATVTAGVPTALGATYAIATTVYALTATTALVIYTNGSSTPYTVSAVVVSVTGTTCTVGTPVSPPSSPNQGTTNSQQPGSCLLSPTQALVVTDTGSASTGVIAVTCNVSGTTITWGAQLQVETSSAVFGGALGYNTRFAPRLLTLSATTAFLWYTDSNGYSRSVILTVVGSAVTAGTILYDAISSGPNTIGTGSILPYSAGEFLAVKQRATATSTQSPFLQPSKISGSAVTTGYGQNLPDFGPVYPGSIACSRLSGGDYVLGSIGPATPLLAVFRNNGDAINSRGSIKIPPLTPTATYSSLTQNFAVASNRLVFIGSTAVSGPAATAGGSQTRILSVEIAA